VRVERIDVDSRVLGRSVLAIHDLDCEVDLRAVEEEYVRKSDPVYVSCRIPLEQVANIQFAERHGFHFVECQIRSTIRLRSPYDVSQYPYAFERVRSEEDLREVLEIAGVTFEHDRFSRDPLFPAGVAGRRYQEYVRNSLQSPCEAVYRLLDAERRTVAFKTHRYVSDTEVLFLLGGVHPDFKGLGLGPINEYFEFNELIGEGIRRGVTHISAVNYPVFNLEIGALGFRVTGTFAVLRKCYPAGEAGRR
jgi:hypothetical protein